MGCFPMEPSSLSCITAASLSIARAISQNDTAASMASPGSFPRGHVEQEPEWEKKRNWKERKPQPSMKAHKLAAKKSTLTVHDFHATAYSLACNDVQIGCYLHAFEEGALSQMKLIAKNKKYVRPCSFTQWAAQHKMSELSSIPSTISHPLSV